jgi:hypothetical protein
VNKVFLILLTFCSLFAIGQKFCKPLEIPFKKGEKIIYDVEYKMGKSWVSAGKARFIVKDSLFNNENCFYVEGKGRSLKSYDWFFKVRDKYATFISKRNFKPTHFTRRVREGDFSLDYDYDFNFSSYNAFIKEKRKTNIKYDTIAINKCSYDVMTAVYLARSINFNSLVINDSIKIDIVLDKEIFEDVAIVYKGKKKISAQKGLKINCIHFQLELIEGTIFKGNEKMDVFVSDDINKVPVYIEAEIIVGSIRVYAKSVEGTKEPLKYLH